MKKLHAGMGLLLGGLLVLTLAAQEPAVSPQAPRVVVGTFDSRAIAVAYIRSDAHAKRLNKLRAEVEAALAEARAAGDEARVAELEARGPALQRKAHQQGFSTAPVDDILVHVEDQLPAIAKEAGVDVIVSKWVLTYKRPTASFVDVTEALVAEFDPDEATMKVIKQLLATDPVPLDQLGEDD